MIDARKTSRADLDKRVSIGRRKRATDHKSNGGKQSGEGYGVTSHHLRAALRV
jgi:hypothetical protein